MRRRWTSKDLLNKPLPDKAALEQIDREQKARIAQTAEQERQEFIEYIRRHTGVELKAELKFHDKRKWRFDFYNEALKICIEVDGGIWQEISGHNSGTGILNSMHKRNEAICHGWRAIHITPQERYSDYIIDLINRLIAA